MPDDITPRPAGYSRMSFQGWDRDASHAARSFVFRWTCLAVAAIFLSGLTWMVNDVRLHVRQSGETVQTTGETINKRLPEIVEKVETTTDTLAELAADIRQL